MPPPPSSRELREAATREAIAGRRRAAQADRDRGRRRLPAALRGDRPDVRHAHRPRGPGPADEGAGQRRGRHGAHRRVRRAVPLRTTLTEPMRQLVRITVAAAERDRPARAPAPQIRRPGRRSRGRRSPSTRWRTRPTPSTARRSRPCSTTASQPVELVRQKDMLFSLEDGVDQCEDAMDAIRSVVVKNG